MTLKFIPLQSGYPLQLLAHNRKNGSPNLRLTKMDQGFGDFYELERIECYKTCTDGFLNVCDNCN